MGARLLASVLVVGGAVTSSLAIAASGATLPPHPGPLPSINAGKPGAANVGWLFDGAPHDGVEGLRVTITPTVLEDDPHNIIYWALMGYFLDGSGFYMGLQPHGEFEKTALFSVFGPGTTPLAPMCKSGADRGPGTHCHIPYPWTLGHAYQFTVHLARADAQTMVWEGDVVDLATGTLTPLGDFGVPSARGLLRAEAVTFAEFFKRTVTCNEQPRSEVLWQQLFAYKGGRTFAGAVHSLKANAGCNPQFFGQDRSYVYLDNGG